MESRGFTIKTPQRAAMIYLEDSEHSAEVGDSRQESF